jgi:two-component system KDP operon response regulator KdpE
LTKILVVDDEPEIRSLLGAVLQAKGFEVVTAADGAVALEQVQREHPSALGDEVRAAIDGSGVHGHHR